MVLVSAHMLVSEEPACGNVLAGWLMEGFGYLPWLSEMLRKFACFHSRGAVGIGSSRAAKGRRRGNLILLGGNEERSLCSATESVSIVLLLLPRPPGPHKSVHVITCSEMPHPPPHSLACNLSDPHRSCPSSTTISSNHHVPPRPLRISRSPLTPFRCNHSVPHHCCVSSFLGIQPPGRRMSVSVHAFMISLFGH